VRTFIVGGREVSIGDVAAGDWDAEKFVAAGEDDGCLLSSVFGDVFRQIIAPAIRSTIADADRQTIHSFLITVFSYSCV
jgi:hypothetical protein